MNDSVDKVCGGRPVVLCAADLTHASAAAAMLKENFEVVFVKPDADKMAGYLDEIHGYFASLHVRFTGEMIRAAVKLKAIATPSTGLDHIDVDAAKDCGVVVLSLKEDREFLNTITATAELAWGLLLACARRLPGAVGSARSGVWARDGFRGHQLSSKVLGILGCGRLGTMVAQYGLAFGMKVIGHDVKPIKLDGVEAVGFEELLQRSDVLSVHIHLTEANRGLIDRAAIGKMKAGAILINTSRGAIVDEGAMLEALQEGRLGAAGLDVIDGEWREDLAEHPLIRYSREHEHLVITPHIGGVTYESQESAYTRAAGKLVDYFRVNPIIKSS